MLAFVEGSIIFFAVYLRFLLLDGALPSPDSSTVLAQALTLTLCGLFAFHFNDLYDLRRFRKFRQFAARLPLALAMMVLLWAVVEWVIPGLRASWRSVAEALAVVVALLLPLRATLHYLFAAHPFSRRVLVLGLSLIHI